MNTYPWKPEYSGNDLVRGSTHLYFFQAQLKTFPWALPLAKWIHSQVVLKDLG